MTTPGERHVDLVDAGRSELLQADLDRAVLVVLGDEQRPEVLVPRAEEREHAERRDGRARERDRDPQS